MKDLKKINTEIADLGKLQDNVENWVSNINKNTIANGSFLGPISIAAGTVNNIEHKLGRQLKGWLVVGQNSNASIWDSQDANVFKSKFLALNCSANVTINLWVF